MNPRSYCIAALLVLPLPAPPRTSANYLLDPETTDGGGGRSSSAS